jgi:hypothetical protein
MKPVSHCALRPDVLPGAKRETTDNILLDSKRPQRVTERPLALSREPPDISHRCVHSAKMQRVVASPDVPILQFLTCTVQYAHEGYPRHIQARSRR